MSSIGYARVSTAGQDTATQVARLKAAGCDIVREEKASGKSRDGRSELDTILSFIRLRIPVKPDAYSEVKSDTYSDFIPDSVPI